MLDQDYSLTSVAHRAVHTNKGWSAMTEAQEERTASAPMCINSAEEEYESTPVAVLGPLCITAIAALLIRAGPQHTEEVSSLREELRPA